VGLYIGRTTERDATGHAERNLMRRPPPMDIRF
jgi:hypothetical protein